MSSSTPVASESNEMGSIEVKTENFTIEWIIREFTQLPQNNGKYILSPMFRAVDDEVKWRLVLYPRGDDKNNADYVEIYLYVLPQKNGPLKIEANVEISILPSGRTDTFVHTYERKQSWGFNRIIKRAELLALLESPDSDDAVTIRCKIDIPRGTIRPIDTPEDREQASDSQEGQLSQAFRSCLNDPRLSDVVLIVGDSKFPAHKLILAARSPIFSAMFDHERTVENFRHPVEIENMEPAVVEAMLEFFYTDEVTNLEELACELLEAADRYDVQRLRSMCENVLHKSLNAENATKILIHADKLRSFKLKAFVLEFIEDHLSDVVESEGYKEIEENYPALLKEMMRSVAGRHKSKKQKLAE